ncbi:MAG: HD domain-containing protein [Pseudomonadota bacterium]|nr:HD domain-containing protein [Pseudomonadota bacterium]
MADIDTSKDEELLKKHYRRCYAKVSGSDFYKLYADEKIRHSFQVVGAGNYIMRREQAFSGREGRFLLSAKLAYLFHDIGRFMEIERLYDEEPHPRRHDHSLYSYEILKSIPEYARPEILLPVKHHGHMIEDLYNDAEFTAITDEKLKNDILKIAFLVRDADKIANFYLMKTAQKASDNVFEHLFLSKTAPGGLTPVMAEDFLAGRMPKRSDIKTSEDWILSYISWIYDLNYKASFDFCRLTGCFDNLLSTLDKYNRDKGLQQRISETISNYIKRRYQQFKEEQS